MCLNVDRRSSITKMKDKKCENQLALSEDDFIFVISTEVPICNATQIWKLNCIHG